VRKVGYRVTARARTREDRAGDPLDGLVNLFDIGIVLSVAFLLAALSSLDLTSVLTDPEQARSGDQAPADSVVLEPNESLETIVIEPGQEVAGRGQEVGTVYELEDGRTVIVRPDGAPSGQTP
jgi:hypothetical protein